MSERTVTDLLSLEGKVALLTGAAGWLGSAMSRGLAEAGATVAVTSRDTARAAEFAASLPGDRHVGLGFAQDDSDSIPGLVRTVVERLGAIDVLVNNAYGSSSPGIEGTTAADMDQAYHTGVTTPFLLAREVADHLRGRGAPGSIVNISSMYGVVASYPDAYFDVPVNSPPNYHGLKGGLIQLTRHLAVYWARDGIRVNAISPGPFPTSKTEADLPTFIERLEQRVPMGRMGRPEELKGLIVLLASDAGGYLTGQNILVDGGWTAW